MRLQESTIIVEQVGADLKTTVGLFKHLAKDPGGCGRIASTFFLGSERDCFCESWTAMLRGRRVRGKPPNGTLAELDAAPAPLLGSCTTTAKMRGKPKYATVRPAGLQGKWVSYPRSPVRRWNNSICL